MTHKSTGGTNDHVVPQMYLRRFAAPRSGGHRTEAALVESLGKSFVTHVRNVGAINGFYWGTDPEGVPHHDMEDLLTFIEDAATGAFRYLLDHGRAPADDAFPRAWPTRHDIRLTMSWWIAAQLLRTAPQRDRLWRLAGEPLATPRGLGSANPHLRYMLDAIGPLARLIYVRPWGFGFSGLCLFTSDVPVQILNQHDDDDPVVAASFWDMYLPLDPHRFLFLPGQMHVGRRDLMRDHLINMSGGFAIMLNQTMIENAHTHVMWHPDHDPRSRSNVDEGLSMRRSRLSGHTTKTLMQYNTLTNGYGVERKWLDVHTWDDPAYSAQPSAQPAKRDEELIKIVERMTQQIDQARQTFDELTRTDTD